MRKTIAVMIAAGVVAAAVVAPAYAAKKKTVTEEWTATNPVPFPGQDAGCTGQETLSKTSHPFTAPGTGTLDVSMDNFVGDWDLYVYDTDGNILGASEGDTAATVERIAGLRLRKKTEVNVVLCNWSGGPTADAHLTYVYK